MGEGLSEYTQAQVNKFLAELLGNQEVSNTVEQAMEAQANHTVIQPVAEKQEAETEQAQEAQK